MARNDMIANHKKGLVNSTVGNGVRGWAGGALAFGGLAAVVTIATGGLALPLMVGAIAGSALLGGAAVGTLNAIGGGVRWGLETLGGIIGINRKQNNTQMDNGYGPEQQQQKGLGLAEGLVALAGAAMGTQSIKNSMRNKLADAYGFDDKGAQQEQSFEPQYTQYNAPDGRPIPRPILEDKKTYNEKGDIEFSLTREDLANPAVRDAVKDFGRAQAGYRNALWASNDPDSKLKATEMQRTTRFVDENGVRDPSKMPSFDSQSGTYTLRPEHFMNESVQQQMSSEGKAHQKTIDQAAREAARELKSEYRSLTDVPLIQRAQNSFVDPAQQQQTATDPAPQQVAPQQPVARQAAPQQTAAPIVAEPVAGRHKAPESMGNMDAVNEAARQAAQGAKDSGVVHKGGAHRAQAGSTAAKPEGPAAQTTR